MRPGPYHRCTKRNSCTLSQGRYINLSIITVGFWRFLVEWIGMCSVLRPRQHSIHVGRRFYRSNDPTNSIKVIRHEHKTQQVPSLQYGVTRGQLPQRAGSPGLNGGGTAAAVPLLVEWVNMTMTLGVTSSCWYCVDPLTLTVAIRVQPWASECPDVKNYKWWLNLVWHRMLYSCSLPIWQQWASKG